MIKHTIIPMAIQSPKQFLPTADDVLNADLPRRGRILLIVLKSYEGQGTVYQHNGGINREYFFGMMERRNMGLGPLPSQEPEYGADQSKVSMAFREAWNWLENESYLIHTPGQPASDWFSITPGGEKFWAKAVRFEQWEKEGLDAVKHKSLNDPLGGIGGSPEVRQMAGEWVRMKENKPPVKHAPAAPLVMVADSRLAELRALKSPQFDFQKLIRLCEELNTASREDCYLSIGMLTRALLDHVPPVFGVKSFSEVANNYIGGSKSFKDTMLHLDTAAKKIADGFLHTQIRRSETLPTAQQVNFGAQLDVLLGEIVRIIQ
jgi:hypothetical protein